ncbi:MAG: DUF4406 domain-containing protein [Lentisphaeria bacterium]|nr:DUF4406 domain-containing protein [Lentisphaeria bacterium]
MKESSIEKTDTVYIAGPMTGKFLLNYPRFFGMAELLRKTYSCKVLNPARQPDGLEYGEYMRRALRDLIQATAVVLLDGWEASSGAVTEHDAAKLLGLKIYEERVVVRDMNCIMQGKNPSIRIGIGENDDVSA